MRATLPEGSIQLQGRRLCSQRWSRGCSVKAGKRAAVVLPVQTPSRAVRGHNPRDNHGKRTLSRKRELRHRRKVLKDFKNERWKTGGRGEKKTKETSNCYLSTSLLDGGWARLQQQQSRSRMNSPMTGWRNRRNSSHGFISLSWDEEEAPRRQLTRCSGDELTEVTGSCRLLTRLRRSLAGAYGCKVSNVPVWKWVDVSLRESYGCFKVILISLDMNASYREIHVNASPLLYLCGKLLLYLESAIVFLIFFISYWICYLRPVWGTLCCKVYAAGCIC